ncbi:MAG: type VI secretion system baseplate subunit TssF [Pseudomonadota bacterium]
MNKNKRTLLNYYQEELAYVRHEAQAFAKRYPRIASHLHLSPDVIEDPHVNRLIEAFALLNSRIRCQIDDQFPNLIEALLDIIFPGYLVPIPSMSIVQFRPQNSLTGSFLLNQGTLLETPPTEGEPCQFSTCYDTTLWPVSITTAQCVTRTAESLSYAGTPSETKSHLILSLRCNNPEQRFDTLAPDKLRFHIKGANALALSLYEYLFAHCLGMSVINPAEPSSVCFSLGPQAIEPVGFNTKEAILPEADQDFIGHRLLLEFFTFKAKFLFFDVNFGKPLHDIGNTLIIMLHFKAPLNNQLPLLNADHLALNCTPIINRFSKIAEPLIVDGKRDQYPIVADKSYPDHYHVLQIKQIDDITDMSHPQTLTKLYDAGSTSHPSTAMQWSTKRLYNEENDTERTLLTLTANSTAEPSKVLQIYSDSFNGNIPHLLSFPNKTSHFQFADGSAPVSLIQCLSQPTPVYRQHLDHQGKLPWQFITKLSLNYRHFLHNDQALEMLRNTLALYNLGQPQENAPFIDSIIDIETKKAMKRIPGSLLNPFVYGHTVTIHFDARKTTAVSNYLFVKVLEQFLTGYQAINSFIDVKTVTRSHETKDV